MLRHISRYYQSEALGISSILGGVIGATIGSTIQYEKYDYDKVENAILGGMIGLGSGTLIPLLLPIVPVVAGTYYVYQGAKVFR